PGRAKDRHKRFVHNGLPVRFAFFTRPSAKAGNRTAANFLPQKPRGTQTKSSHSQFGCVNIFSKISDISGIAVLNCRTAAGPRVTESSNDRTDHFTAHR